MKEDLNDNNRATPVDASVGGINHSMSESFSEPTFRTDYEERIN